MRTSHVYIDESARFFPKQITLGREILGSEPRHFQFVPKLWAIELLQIRENTRRCIRSFTPMSDFAISPESGVIVIEPERFHCLQGRDSRQLNCQAVSVAFLS